MEHRNSALSSATFSSLCLLGLSLPARAAVTVKVCPDGSGTYTTIQAAVNAVSTGSTLRLCSGTYHENVSVNGKALTVTSIGTSADTFVDGGGAGPVFAVSGSGNLSLYDLTIQNGSSASGGGVSCSNATLLVDTSVVTGNDATNGGGVYANACTVKVRYSTLLDNEATTSGGAIYTMGGTPSLISNEIYQNSAGEGGGIFTWDGSALIKGNDVHDNEATTTDETLHGPGGGGGGIFAYGGVNIKDNTVEANTSAYDGGGIYLYQGTAVVSGNTVTDNDSANDGGGVYTNYDRSTILENVISSNTAGDDGGGLRVYVGSSIIESNTIDDNTAADDGGGLKVSHRYNEIVNNSLSGNTAGDAGGGIELDNDTSLVQGCTLTSNRAARGAGLHANDPYGALNIDDLDVTSNVATSAGGGIAIENAPYGGTLMHLNLTRNRAPTGGGLYGLDSNFDLTNSVLWYNSGTTAGGGLYLDGTTGALANDVLYANLSYGGAGVVFVDAVAVRVYNTIVLSNVHSAGVTVSGTGPSAWFYNDVYNNTSAYSGLTDPTGSSGNLAVNPKLNAPSTGDFTLKSTSPCIDTGNPAVLDLDGTRSDMGAFGGPLGSD